MILITDAPIDLGRLREDVASPAHGAIVLFDGVVRDHDHGRPVASLEYQVHPDAQRFLEEICASVAEAHPDVLLGAVHRYGPLEIGDVAFAAAVSSAHRARAFEVCALLVDRVKDELPIWKKQVFADGSHEWVNAA